MVKQKSQPAKQPEQLGQIINVRHLYPELQETKIKIERGQRGGYGWEISIGGTDEKEIMARIKEIDKSLTAEYGNTGKVSVGNGKEKEKVETDPAPF